MEIRRRRGQTSLVAIVGWLLLGASSAATLSPVAAQERARAFDPAFELPTDVRLLQGLVYRIDGADTLRLDLFVPTGQGPMPAIIYVTGLEGPGRTEQLWRQAAQMAGRGFVGAAIDYRRRTPDGRGIVLPAAVVDVKVAVRWMRAHAEEYRIDPARIGLVGASKGGLLAALAASQGGGGSNDYPDMSHRVQAVALFNPVLDLSDAALPPASRRMLEDAFGTSAWSDTSFRARMSAIGYITPENSRDLTPNLPPFLLLHGTADQRIPFAQSLAMAERLRADGVAVEVFTADGGEHGFFNQPPWYGPTLEALNRFFTRTLVDDSVPGRWVDSQPRWSPDGQQIAFASDFGGTWQIWVMRADGSDARSLGVSSYGPAAWSPDGSRLAYMAFDRRFWTVKPDGTGAAPLSREPTGGNRPSWSPDGRHIAFGTWTDGALYLLNVADGTVTRLTATTGSDECPSWSPDASTIFFHAQTGDQADVYAIASDGTNRRRITHTPRNEFCPAVSPDGRHVAVQRRTADAHEHIDILVIALDGSGESNLTDHVANDRYASWSPDGQWLAFNSTRDGNSEIYVVRADGTGLRRLTDR